MYSHSLLSSLLILIFGIKLATAAATIADGTTTAPEALTAADVTEAAKRLPAALCTPEDSHCRLASDANASSCFRAGGLERNFYFSAFNTVGRPVTVDSVRILSGSKSSSGYTVSLASNAKAENLACRWSADASGSRWALVCPAHGLSNVTSLMIQPAPPAPSQLRLLEVVAIESSSSSSSNYKKQLKFSYCDSDEPAVCERAIDGRADADSQEVVAASSSTSSSAMFPRWFGGFDEPAVVGSVQIYRRSEMGTFFRVRVGGYDCQLTKSTDRLDALNKEAEVEALEFKCPDGPGVPATSLVEVWEIPEDYLISLCEVEVSGWE